jgi:hypothetical protein
MWKDRVKLNEVPGKAAPKRRDHLKDEEEGQGSDGLFYPGLKNKGDDLPCHLWRGKADREPIQYPCRVPGLLPITVVPI